MDLDLTRIYFANLCLQIIPETPIDQDPDYGYRVDRAMDNFDDAAAMDTWLENPGGPRTPRRCARAIVGNDEPSTLDALRRWAREVLTKG